jgi:chorismate mutase
MISEREQQVLDKVRHTFAGLPADSERVQHLMFAYMKHEMKLPHSQSREYTRRLINEAMRK